MKLINKKNIYLLSLIVICLLMVVIVPTYAKFASTYETTDDIVGIGLDFNVDIINVEEYEQFVVAAGSTYEFNIKLTNASSSEIYYGIWYRMVNPTEKNNDILIGKVTGSEVATSGSIGVSSDIIVSVAIMNNTINDVTVDIGVGSSTTSISNIEYLDGRYLVNDDIVVPKDINISSIKINNVTSNSLPTSGLYDMTYTCSKGSQLEWDAYSKSIIYKSGSYIKDSCSLNFTTSTTKKYLNEMPVGSYVAYEGKGGKVGSTSVSCKKNGAASSSTPTAATEAPNSCLGQNAREDLDNSGYTYGYCNNADYKYYTTGWRIAYIDDTTSKVAIISAGSPECYDRAGSSDYNATNIQAVNALALKYCNSDFVDGNCTCTGSSNKCTSPSTDAWAINDDTFNKMTEQATGVIGGGYLYVNIDGAINCGEIYSTKVCGYNNDLIDNGGYYWFASYSPSSNTSGVLWSPSSRIIMSYTGGAYGIRPVISLSSSVFVTGGNGTIVDPYTISK